MKTISFTIRICTHHFQEKEESEKRLTKSLILKTTLKELKLSTDFLTPQGLNLNNYFLAKILIQRHPLNQINLGKHKSCCNYRMITSKW